MLNEINMLKKNTQSNVDSVEESEALLDGATAQTPVIDPELKEQVKASSNLELPTLERIEAFRDIVDREIGDTALTRGRNIEREINLRNIYLKFEGGNPTGTHKDRIAFAQAGDALRRGYDAVTLATCGNYGAAMALACKLSGLKCYIYIPEGYKTKRIAEMEKYGAKIFFAGKDYEATTEISRKMAERELIYDANPGGANTAIQLEAYAQISYEIYDELRDAPAVVAVPVSNGTTLAGIYLGFLSLYRRCKTSRIPKIIAGSSYRKNPIIHSFIKGYPECRDLNPGFIKETIINEPLINWHSIDGNEALKAIRDSNGTASYVSDKSMKDAARMLKETDGILVLPASTAGLIAMINQHKIEAYPGDRYVAVITGKQTL
ncbi:MAG: threonine synthase [Rickettsiales bacterium]|jgi:threonine synthase